MSNKEKKEKGKSKFFKGLKAYLCISASLLVVLLTALIILLITRFKDNNRSTYNPKNISYTEIVKKNYIDGFTNTKNNGKFSYILPNDDINELLYQGTKSLSDKHIENMYFDSDEQGLRYFFVDLKKVGIKTRVVITTVPSIKDENTINLSIAQVSVGKVNALDFLKKKGYITSDFINPYFKSCHLPISFNDESLSFELKPYDWIKLFPESIIGDEIFKSLKDKEGAYSFNYNLFGFDLDISKLSSGREYIDLDISETPDLYNEVKNGLLNEYPSMGDGETKAIFSFSEEDFNKHIKSSFESNKKEEIASTYTTNKVIFDLIGANVHLDQEDYLTFTLFFSINGYLISLDSSLECVSSSPIYYGSYFEKGVSQSKMINEGLQLVLGALGNSYSYFEFTANEMLYINLESLNDDSDISLDIKFSQKDIEIASTSKSLDFLITK